MIDVELPEDGGSRFYFELPLNRGIHESRT
jgi:hypothetical protein